MLSKTAPLSRLVLSFVIAAVAAGIAFTYRADLAVTLAAGKAAPAVKRGPATIVLQDGYDLPAVFDQARPSGDARPTMLATADFDVDGFPDLVSGYATGKGGYIVIQRGNPEAFAPTKPENVEAIGQARFPVAFLPETKLIELNGAPDLIAVGDFNRDTDPDIITASRGGTELTLITGDGDGEFPLSGKIAMPGRVTTLAAGQIDLTDGKDDLAVGIETDSGGALLVYNDDNGVNGASTSHDLPAAPQSVISAEMDETLWRDVAILAGGDVFILHGRNQRDGNESAKKAASRLERVDLPFAARAMAVGQFIWDRNLRNDLALLRDDGSVALLTRGEQDERPFTIAEVRERRAQQRRIAMGEEPAAPLTNWRPNPPEKWTVAESLSVMDPSAAEQAAAAKSPVMFRALLSDQNAEDLVVIDSATQKLKVFAVEAPPKLGNGEIVSFAGPRAEMALPTAGAPVAALSMRTGLFARPGLVLLKDGSDTPEIIPAAPTATFTVDRTDDNAAATACTAGANDCSLRGAHSASNGLGGADIITLPAGTYQLTIANAGGNNEDTGANGDLDVNDGTTLNGASAATTIIQAGTTNANGIDKVAGYNPICTSNLSHSINNVTYKFGRNTQPFGAGDFSYTGGGMDICNFGSGTISMTNSVVSDSTNTDGPAGGLNVATAMGDTSTVNITGSTFNANRLTRALGGTQGGGINLGNGATNINITNCQITNNITQNGNNVGGGLYSFNIMTSATMVHGTTISGNTANGQGGGVYISGQQTVSNTIDQASVVNGNSSTSPTVGTASEGGGVYASVFLTNTLTFTEVTFTNNAATSGLDLRGGGGIGFGQGNATVSFCRFSGNTATSGTGLRKDNNPGSITAQNNWWGCSGGPGTAGCQTAVLQGAPATLNTVPFLQLRTTASPTTVLVGQTSALTASFLLNSGGGAIPASSLDTLIGQTVNWSGVNGSISGAQTTIQAAGTATATYTGTSAGAGSATAQVDGGPASGSLNTVAITVNPASTTAAIISDSPDPSNVGQNVTVAYSVSVNSPGGGTPTGNVQVSDGVNSCTGTVAAGSCVVALNTAGNRTLTATYQGDSNYNASPASAGAGHLVGTVTWTGATNSTFATNSNWNTGLAPGSADTAVIPTGATNQPTIGSAASVSSLSVASGRILTVNSTLTVSGTLTNNGTIGGTGTIVNNFTNGASGIVAPGLSPGILNITGNYTNAGAYNVEIGGTGGAGVNPNGHDQLLVSGTATVGGTLNVTLTNGFTPTAGNSFRIIDAATSSGTFATTNLPNILPNLWFVQYDNPAGNVILHVIPPTAAAASISGRVLTAENSGISRANVSVTAPNGTVYRATTNSFGYFRVEGLPTGATYTVTVTRKGYQFGQRIITLSQDVVDLDIIAIE